MEDNWYEMDFEERLLSALRRKAEEVEEIRLDPESWAWLYSRLHFAAGLGGYGHSVLYKCMCFWTSKGPVPVLIDKGPTPAIPQESVG